MASAATSRRPSGPGSSDGDGTGQGRGQHPRRRPLEPRLRGPPGAEGGRRPDPPRRHGRPFRPEPHVRREDHQAPPPPDGAAVRRAPDDQRAWPLHRGVPRRRLRLDHVPRRDRGADRADAPRDPRRRPGGGPRRPTRDAAVGPRAVPGAARHRPRDDRRAGLRRSELHEGRREGQDPARARPAAPQGAWGRGARRRRHQPRDSRVRGGPGRRHPRRRLGAVHQGPRHGPRDPADPRARRRGLPVRPQRWRAADPARPDGPASPRCRSRSRAS